VPYLILTTALGLRADLPHGRFETATPMSFVGPVRLSGLRLGGHLVDVRADGAAVTADGLPDGVRCGTRPDRR
jgi:hypothetical protein